MLLLDTNVVSELKKVRQDGQASFCLPIDYRKA